MGGHIPQLGQRRLRRAFHHVFRQKRNIRDLTTNKEQQKRKKERKPPVTPTIQTLEWPFSTDSASPEETITSLHAGQWRDMYNPPSVSIAPDNAYC